MAETFHKTRRAAPEGFFAAEAAGLAWLAEPGAIPVVEVRECHPDALVLERLSSASPDRAAARTFGARLAALHDSGAPSFGWAPAEQAWFGPLEAPFPVATDEHADYTEYWVEDRLLPIRDMAAPRLGTGELRAVDAAIAAVATGAFAGIAGGPDEPASRVHGDLWSGNVMWARRTADGGPEAVEGVLIDPAAHGGHRLEDLALLALFGAPHLEDIYAGYAAAHPLPTGWQDDLPAHVLFCLLAHVYLFGGGYGPQAAATAGRIVDTAAGRHPEKR